MGVCQTELQEDGVTSLSDPKHIQSPMNQFTGVLAMLNMRGLCLSSITSTCTV